MTERPILFSDAMVRAILDGRKTQTRRIAKRRHFSEELHARALHVGVEAALLEMPDPPHVRSPFGAPGDLLWVRECFAELDLRYSRAPLAYRADNDGSETREGFWRWTPSIHMPRWASRLSLRVTSIRVERLQDISEEDARAEGVEQLTSGFWRDYESDSPICSTVDAVVSFRTLWDSLAPEGSTWADNPWVWAVGFEREEPAR